VRRASSNGVPHETTVYVLYVAGSMAFHDLLVDLLICHGG
jgi:hypothetical protein